MDKLTSWIEELSMNAVPSLNTILFDGWILRFSEGYDYKVNSINPLYTSTYELNYKIEYCEKKYSSLNLPIIYKLTENNCNTLDKELDTRQYKQTKESKVMTLSLSNMEIKVQPSVKVLNYADDKWLKGFCKLANIKSKSKQYTSQKIINNIQSKIVCSYIEQNNLIIACGLGVIERGFVGLFDINVAPMYRRIGFGSQICNSILREAIKYGAYMSYLQVSISNRPAIALYRKLGFIEQYKYWYRIKDLKSIIY